MFRKLIVSKNKGIEKFAKFFYKENGDDSNEYAVCQYTGLSYLGEFFERFERESINPLDIVHGIACGTTELPEHQIYQGQLEGFLERLDLIMKSNTDFLDVLTYTIFLQKMGIKEEAKSFLDNIVNNLELDLNFLVFTLAVYSKNIIIDEDIRESVIKLLNDKKLSFDLVSVADNIDTLYESTELSGLRYIEKAFSLKTRDIKDSGKLNFYKSLKKIGTKNLIYDDIKDYINLTKQEFYFASIKVANESYVKGASLYSINQYLFPLIKDSIDVNSKLYPYLLSCKFVIGKDCTKGLNLYEIDYNNTKRNYYKQFWQVFSMNYDIDYSKYKELIEKPAFIKFFSNLDYNEYKKSKIKMILEIIANSDKKDIRDAYFSNIEDLEDVDLFNNFILIDKGYLNLKDFMEDKIVKITHVEDEIKKSINLYLNKYGERDNIRYYYQGIVEKYNLENLAVDMVYYFLDNDIKLEYIDYNKLNVLVNDCYTVALKKYAKEQDRKEKENILKKIDDFVFMYDSYNYVAFLIDVYNNEDMNSILNISEKEIIEIAKQCTPLYNDYKINKRIKSILSEEKSFLVDEAKKLFNTYINSDWSFLSSGMKYIFDAFKAEFNKCDYEQKEMVANYIKDNLINTEEIYVIDTLMKHLRLLVSNNVIKKADAIEILDKFL